MGNISLINKGDIKKPFFFFYSDNELYFFKKVLNEEKYLIIGDVFSSFFFEKVGIDEKDYVKYYPAIMEIGKNKIKGVVCKSFVKENQPNFSLFDIQLYNYCKENNKDFWATYGKDGEALREIYFQNMNNKINFDGQYVINLENTMEDIFKFCKYRRLKCDYDNIEEKLNLTVLVDYFLSQADRNGSNIIFKEENGELKICPIFDNQRCLGLSIKDISYNAKQIDAFGEFYPNLVLGISAQGMDENANDNFLLANNGVVVRDLISVINGNEKIKQIAKNIVKCDGEKIMQEFEDKILSVPRDEKELMISQFKKRKRIWNEKQELLNLILWENEKNLSKELNLEK